MGWCIYVNNLYFKHTNEQLATCSSLDMSFVQRISVNRDMPHTCLVHCINFEHEHTNPANLDTEEARITADIALRNYHHDLRILALFNSRLKQALANDLAFEHKQDRARRGPNVIAQRLSQRLTVDYELLTSQQDLYHDSGPQSF